MKSFKEFLKESNDLSFDELVAALATKCRPFIEQHIAVPLYRGIPQKIIGSKPLFTHHPQSRTPRDSELWFNFMFNAGIEVAFDIRSVRKSCVFATGNAADSSAYGEICFFIPAGNSKFVWSPFVEDSHEDSDGFMENIADKFLQLGKIDSSVTGSNIKNALTQIFKNLQHTTSAHNWSQGKSEAETEAATEEVNKYLGIQLGSTLFYERLQEAISQTFSELYEDSTNLDEAVKSKNEVLFYETAGYFVIPVNFVTAEMDKRGLNSRSEPRYEWYKFLIQCVSEHIKSQETHK